MSARSPQFRRRWKTVVASSTLLFLLFMDRPQVSLAKFELNSEVDRLIRLGSFNMYSYHLEEADRIFEELIRLHPEHPVGYMYKAEVVWWRALRDNANRTLESSFEQLSSQAISKARAILDKNPRDFFARLYLSSTYGNRTRYYLYIQKSYFGALRSGLRGHESVKLAAELNPQFIDCLIGIGTYNYFADSMPKVIKPFAWLFGTRGNRDEGIRQLKLAAEKGEYARTDAKTVLLGIYLNEKQYKEYEELLDTLIAEYPENPVFYMWMESIFVEQKSLKEGIHYFQEKISVPSSGTTPTLCAMYALHEKGRLELQMRATSDAIASFSRIVESQTSDRNLLSRTHLLFGQACDLEGKREKAVLHYQALLKLPDIEGTHAKAQRYLKRPYRRSM